MALYGYGARRSSGCSTWWLVLGVVGLLVGLGLAAFLALPQLTSVTPAADAALVSAGAPLRLNFNRPMDTASVEQALTLTPPIAGGYSWEGNTLVFRPA